MLTTLNAIQQSIFGRLLFIFFITAASILLVLFLSLKMATKDGESRRERFSSLFSDHANYLISDIGTPPDIEKAKAIAKSLHIQIMITHQNFLWKSSKTLVDPRDITIIHNHHSQISNRRTPITFSVGSHNRERFFIIEKEGYTYYLTGVRSFIKEDGYLWFWVALVLCSLILYLSYRSVNWLFSPLQLVLEGAQIMERGDLSHRLPCNRNDEVGKIPQAVNRMANELEKMLEAKRQLLLAISHELRTPITRANVGIEFIDNVKIKKSLQEDLAELDRLIGELLESERLNQKHHALNINTVNMTNMIASVIQTADPDNTRIQTKALTPNISLEGDSIRLELLLKNIINNGMKYGGDKPLTIQWQTDDDSLTIAFKDNGKGIEKSHLPHITEPFYRADGARQRQTGGYGLGLYLCRLIVEAHRGLLHIDSTVGQGTTITVTLPIRHNMENVI